MSKPSFKMTKFHYQSRDEAKLLQQAMFTLGFCWKRKQSGEVRSLNANLDDKGFIFVDQDCRLTHSSEWYGLSGETRHNAAFASVLFAAAAEHKRAKKAERSDRRKRKQGWIKNTGTKPAGVGEAELLMRNGERRQTPSVRNHSWSIPYVANHGCTIEYYRPVVETKTVSFADMVGDITSGAISVTADASIGWAVPTPPVFSGMMKAAPGTFADAALDPSANPKHAIGNTSLPMTMPSALFRAMVALGKQNGALKYGGANYIGTPVVMSTYMNAIQRHFDKILMGEDCDEVDGVPHWGAIGANIDIIVSAQAAGTLIDDRLRADGQLEAFKALTPLVGALAKLHEGRNPKHFYMKDKP